MKPARVLAYGAFAVAAATSASCSRLEPAAADPLAGTAWRLAEIEGGQPLPGITVSAEFDKGSVGGSAGCNRYGASYELDGERFRVGDIQLTLRACVEPEGAMDQEQKFVRLLASAERYELTGGMLRMFEQDTETLVFRPED